MEGVERKIQMGLDEIIKEQRTKKKSNTNKKQVTNRNKKNFKNFKRNERSYNRSQNKYSRFLDAASGNEVIKNPKTFYKRRKPSNLFRNNNRKNEKQKIRISSGPKGRSFISKNTNTNFKAREKRFQNPKKQKINKTNVFKAKKNETEQKKSTNVNDRGPIIFDGKSYNGVKKRNTNKRPQKTKTLPTRKYTRK
ncbi:hypothetical protein M0812_13698 [Anaeramoeba flamelloides]|uniref:Uncharacterized protein n=1 Tax=Anaeramoeba flamelloides TaxID=1746091 RepID=A0AAV7ZNZ3_9EUKA|nr:hypothetical protein M0812_13698 [Anaeramoeba flamelloides]